jgi:hypothetical protein
MRRITGVTGAALVVLGFVGFIGGSFVESLADPWPLLTLFAVAFGFVLIREAQVVWPQDGTSYPWRRRLAGFTIGVAALASAFAARSLLAAALPNNWIGHGIALVAGVAVGDVVFRQLRDAYAHRSVPRTTPGPAEDTSH